MIRCVNSLFKKTFKIVCIIIILITVIYVSVTFNKYGYQTYTMQILGVDDSKISFEYPRNGSSIGHWYSHEDRSEILLTIDLQGDDNILNDILISIESFVPGSESQEYMTDLYSGMTDIESGIEYIISIASSKTLTYGDFRIIDTGSVIIADKSAEYVVFSYSLMKKVRISLFYIFEYDSRIWSIGAEYENNKAITKKVDAYINHLIDTFKIFE